MDKKRIIISYSNLPSEVLEALRIKYPLGYSNFVMKVQTSKDNFFYAVTVDTDDTSYLVKVPVKIDTKSDKDDEDIFDDTSNVKDQEENAEEEEPEAEKED
ncbi:MAG: hypothetical protein ACOYMF_09440 [Bacteroidales bacterium]